MTKPIQLKTVIPFCGFYESWYSSEVDHVEEMECENFEERECEIAEELRITGREYGDLLCRFTDYSAAYWDIARAYSDQFNTYAKDALGFDPGMTFETMQSPREYNFTTDRIFCFIPLSIVRRLFALSKAESHATLAKTISKHFTSYDGFLSFYTTNLDAWLEKPLREWDHNEVETLLIACLQFAPNAEDDWEMQIFESLMESCYNAWSNAVDWQKVETKIAEIRADKEVEARADDPEYIAPAPRCQSTIDMFTGRAG